MRTVFKRLLYYLLILLLFLIAYFVYIYNDVVSISKGRPIPNYNEQRAAVLVIDIQEGITGSAAIEEHYREQSTGFIRNVNEVITKAYANDLPIVYIQQQTENKLLNWLSDYVLAKGHPGVALDERLKVLSLNRFTKRKSDAFSSHDLEVFLLKMQINNLIITGLDIEGCAYRTSMAGLNRGYTVTIIKEGVITKHPENRDEKLAELENSGAKVINLANFDDLLLKFNPEDEQLYPEN